jgi:hypothetical protein
MAIVIRLLLLDCFAFLSDQRRLKIACWRQRFDPDYEMGCKHARRMQNELW